MENVIIKCIRGVERPIKSTNGYTWQVMSVGLSNGGYATMTVYWAENTDACLLIDIDVDASTTNILLDGIQYIVGDFSEYTEVLINSDISDAISIASSKVKELEVEYEHSTQTNYTRGGTT